VDHAGVSPPLPHLNLSNGNPPEPLEISLNNKSHHAIHQDQDVTEVLNIKLWTFMPPTESVPKLHILIHLEVDQLPLANNHHAQKILSPSLDTNQSKEHLPLKLPVTTDQHQLPSMLKTGLHIAVESSPTVEPLLITPSYLPDIPVLIG